MTATITSIHDDTADQIQARLDGIRALDAMDKSAMLDAQRAAYEKARVVQAEAKADLADIDAQIRVLGEKRKTALGRRDNANLTIRRALEVIPVLEDELA